LGIALFSRLWIPVAFQPLAFASWTILFPLERCAFLAVGRLLDHDPADSIGVSTFHTAEL